MTHNWERYAHLAARILLSAIFLMSGTGKIFHFQGTAGAMAAKGMFAVPFFLTMAILFEVGGGLLVLLGYRARLGALALIVFLIPTTFIFHNFWTFPAAEQQGQMAHFLKNAAILGGLFKVLADGAGGFSLDAARK